MAANSTGSVSYMKVMETLPQSKPSYFTQTINAVKQTKNVMKMSRHFQCYVANQDKVATREMSFWEPGQQLISGV